MKIRTKIIIYTLIGLLILLFANQIYKTYTTYKTKKNALIEINNTLIDKVETIAKIKGTNHLTSATKIVILTKSLYESNKKQYSKKSNY